MDQAEYLQNRHAAHEDRPSGGAACFESLELESEAEAEQEREDRVELTVQYAIEEHRKIFPDEAARQFLS